MFLACDGHPAQIMLGRDASHPRQAADTEPRAGVNNAYLIASRHPLARLYNDNSVLENSHISALYNILAALPELDVFAGLGPDGWRDARKLVIHAILHTDMTYHFPLVSQVSCISDQPSYGPVLAARYLAICTCISMVIMAS